MEPRGLSDRPDGQAASEQTDVECRILEALRGLEFGSVEVIVHDSQVVQIERREKQRLDKPARLHTDDPRRIAPSRPHGQSAPGAH